MENWTSTELVHKAILEDAATIANERAQREGIDPPQQRLRTGTRFSPDRVRTGFATGQIFRADPLASKTGGLCLTIEPSVTNGAPPERIAHLRRMALDAIKQSISDNKSLFAGLILGNLRKGDNYFDRFSDDSAEDTQL